MRKKTPSKNAPRRRHKVKNLFKMLLENQKVNMNVQMFDCSCIRVEQRKRGGPITHRSQDRNLALIIQRINKLPVLSLLFLNSGCFSLPTATFLHETVNFSIVLESELFQVFALREPAFYSRTTLRNFLVYVEGTL